MPAPVGNQFWRARSSHGRKPLFATPDDLWEACSEYFDWVEANPLWETKGFAFQGVVTKETFPKMRAMTITGLCIYIDIATQSWSDYKSREGFSDITTRVEEIIYSQKLEGAAADLLNANIIARELGLKERTEQNITISHEDALDALDD